MLLDLPSGEIAQRAEFSTELPGDDQNEFASGDFFAQWDHSGDWLVVLYSLRSPQTVHAFNWSCLIWDRRIGKVVSHCRVSAVDMLRAMDLPENGPYLAAPAGSLLCYLLSPVDGTTKLIHSLGPTPSVTRHADQPLLAAVRQTSHLAPLRVATGSEYQVFGEANVDPVPRLGGARLMAVSPDGGLAIVHESPQDLGLYDSRYGTRLQGWTHPRLFGFGADGALRVVAGNPSRFQEFRFEAVADSPGVFKTHEQVVDSISIGNWRAAAQSPDGDTFAALRWDKNNVAEIFREGSAGTVEPACVVADRNELVGLAVHPDGDLISLMTSRGQCRIVDSSGVVVRERLGEADDYFRNVFFSPGGTWLVAHHGRKTGFSLWRVADWSAGPSFDDWSECAFSDDDSLLAVGSGMGEVTLWSMAEARPLVRLRTQDLTRFQPQCFDQGGGRLFAVGESTRRIHVWDLRAIRRQLADLGLAEGWPAPSTWESDAAEATARRHPLALVPADPQ
jgi:WD40 repeat protein